LIAAWGEIPKQYQRACLVFAERRVLVIIVRITMNALIEKRTEVMQTLLSMIEPTENERGCFSFHAFRDIEDKNGFNLIAEWETREDLDHYIRSDRFSVLLGTKSLLCEPPQIQIHTVSHSQGMETVNAVRGKRT
jgi:quinol monooxygenase YgiN